MSTWNVIDIDQRRFEQQRKNAWKAYLAHQKAGTTPDARVYPKEMAQIRLLRHYSDRYGHDEQYFERIGFLYTLEGLFSACRAIRQAATPKALQERRIMLALRERYAIAPTDTLATEAIDAYVSGGIWPLFWFIRTHGAASFKPSTPQHTPQEG